MLKPIINSVSPSNVGDFAGCPLKLVLDTDHPREQDDRWISYSSFGVVCHWKAQLAAGAPEVDAPTDKQIQDAIQCPDVPHTPDNFWRRVDECANGAAALVNQITPLPPGVTWVAEKKSYPMTLLPTRVGRRGDVCGFGGSLDLWSSDGKVVWDYKFVGVKKIPRASDVNPKFSSGAIQKVGDAGIANKYLWQVCSYHILEGAEKTGICWMARDGKTKSYVLIDWTTPQAKELAARVRGFIQFTGDARFRELAWPVRGPGCDECTHKDRCPAWCVQTATEPQLAKATGKLDALDMLIAESGVVDMVVPPVAMVGIPPPPPVTFLPPPPPPPVSVLPPPPPPPISVLPPPPPPPILPPKGGPNDLF